MAGTVDVNAGVTHSQKSSKIIVFQGDLMANKCTFSVWAAHTIPYSAARPSEEADSGSTDLGQTLGREACDSVPLPARLLPTMSRGHLPNGRDLVAGLGLFL